MRKKKKKETNSHIAKTHEYDFTIDVINLQYKVFIYLTRGSCCTSLNTQALSY